MTMTSSFSRQTGTRILIVAFLGCVDCVGTNTGNGRHANCPATSSCNDPVDVTGPDGTTYRGRVVADVSVASDGDAGPAAKLEFDGAEIDVSQGLCRAPEQVSRYTIVIFLTSGEASIDALGNLQVHGAPRDGFYASRPSRYPNDVYANDSTTPGWEVDLTLTARGQLTATLSLPAGVSWWSGTTSTGGASTGGASAGGAAGASAGGASAGGAGATSAGGTSALDTPVQVTITGRLDPACAASMRVNDGRTFEFPCWQPTGCGG